MAKASKSRLDLEPLYEAATLAGQATPQMVAKLIARFDSQRPVRDETGNVIGMEPISVKEQVMILRALQGTTLQKPRLEDAEGLMKRGSKITGNTFLSLGTVSLEDLEKLPVTEQERFLLDVLHNRPTAALPVPSTDYSWSSDTGGGPQADRGTGGGSDGPPVRSGQTEPGEPADLLAE